MSLFGKKDNTITEEDVKKINSLLPEQLQKDICYASEFAEQGVVKKHNKYVIKFQLRLNNAQNKLKKIKGEFEEEEELKILIFNTELFEAKPLGFVDLGIVSKFGTASTGNRFESGVIGYAVEGVIDDAWSKSNAQYEAVEKAKLELLKKAKSIYPNCTSIFKFEIDFREIGSSGNVFIYVRGTAAESKNKVLDETVIELEKIVSESENEVVSLEKEINELSKLIKELNLQKKKIPKNALELSWFLNK